MKASLRNSSLLLVTALLCACGEQHSSDSVSLVNELPAAPQKNILIISFDALRYDHLGAYGSKQALTPNMDKFSREALIFDQAYVAGQATPSSFAAAFTGQWPFKVFRKWKLRKTQTLAKIFQKAGYATGGFFNNQHLDPKRRFSQGFDAYQVTVNQTDTEPLKGIQSFLTERADEQFFAWVHFINPHSAYDYREMAKEFYDPDYKGEYQRSSGARIQSYNIEEMSDEDLDRIGQLYDGEVHLADKRFGQLMQRVRELGLADETVVVLTADHGEAYREHGILGHHQLYEEIVRVPLIIRHPDNPQGARVDVPVINIDFLPTLAGIADLNYVPQLVDGVDWRESFNPERPLLFTQMTNEGKLSMAMRKGDMKFLMWCTKREEFGEELYDLSKDPEEQNNVIDQQGYSARADTTFAQWKQMVGGHPCEAIDDAIAGANMKRDLDKEALEKLRSLGYIQ